MILTEYLNAVAKRKCINRKMSGVAINHAVAMQLEDGDIPLLIELIRVQARAIELIMDLVCANDDEEKEGKQTVDHTEEIATLVSKTHLQCERLAESGSTAQWGESGNGHG